MKFIIASMCLGAAVSAEAASRVVLGTPDFMLDRLELDRTAISKVYTFTTPSAQQFKVNVEDFYHKGGYLTMVGRAQESRNSDFILKGGKADIYGWLVLKDRNVAYEYTTDRFGAVTVEQVPVEKIFPVCELEADDHGLPPILNNGPGEDGPEPHIGPYDGTPVNKFQSKPGATKVLYWDISAAPTLWPAEGMWEAWQTYSASVSMFDVNVTTDPEVYNAASPANRGGLRQYPEIKGANQCGIGVYGTSRFCELHKQPNPAHQGGTLGHEGGHLLGLSHDGGPASNPYHPGNFAFQWVPIMGYYMNGLRHAQWVMQYSKGEYSGANQQEDDFQIVTVIRKHLSFRAKTHVGVKALKISQSGKVLALENRGQIVLESDADQWAFTVTGATGRAKLAVNRTERTFGSMLDIEARILSSSGAEVAKNNLPVNRNATFDLPLPAGTYTLVVRAGAEGTPSNGFSTYSSKGFYAIEGDITGGVVAAKPQIDWKNTIAVSPISGVGRMDLGIPLESNVHAITLVSSNGRIMFSSPKRVGSIDMSRFPAGNYQLSIVADGGSLTRSVVKQ